MCSGLCAEQYWDILVCYVSDRGSFRSVTTTTAVWMYEDKLELLYDMRHTDRVSDDA